MGNSSSSLPYSIDNQVGAPHDHNGWALHNGKSTTGDGMEVSVFVGKKPLLAKTPVNQRYPSQMQLIPAVHHYNHCRKLRHPQILKVYATLDTDNPAAASTTDGGGPGPAGSGAASGASSSSSSTTGDLIIVTEPCIPLSQWLLSNPTPEQLAWGLECVVKGLHFLHHSANLAHGNIAPSSLYVTRSGDVKLWNFNLITPVGPAGGGPTVHFQQWEYACTPESYRSPERLSNSWDAIANAGVHVMDSYSLGILIQDYWFNTGRGVNRVPAPLQKAVQRMQTPNLKMRPRLQPLLKCPVFDTPYQKLQLQLEEITIQPVEQKVMLWQNLGQQLQTPNALPKDVALYKVLPLIIHSIQTITSNESMLAQDMYRREVLAMLVPLFFIEEHYQDPSKIGKEMAPLVSKLFLVPDRGVRSVLLNKVGFMTKQLEKSQLNSSVFEPMCSGFNDSSSALRELTLKATLELVPFLNSPNMEKLSRYLVRLQSDAEASIRTNSVIFISKIAPHLSEVSKQKMLLPAYSRAMNDGFAPCRLSALQAALQSKTLFTMKEVATKVMPCIMPLLLDPMADVRREAFRVVQLMLKELEEESKRMETMGVPGQPPQEGIPHQGTAPSTTGRTGPAPAPASGDSAGYLYGLSTWMAGTTTASTPASGAMSTTTTPTKPAVAPPIPTPVSTGAAPSSQPPVQQFASRSFGISAPAPAPVTAAANDGWGDEEDDGWGDDDDGADEDPFANIGAKPVSAAATVPSSFVKAPAPSAALGGFGGGMNDDPFASIGAKPTPVNARGSSGGKLVLPKKTNLAARKVAPPPATKLAVGDDEDLADGWDDF